MTTMESPTTAARQTRNATEKTAETVKQDAHEVTAKADQMFQQQLPTADLAQGVERYFEFVQKAVDVNRELATNWADAVNSLSGVVREQAEKAGQLVTEQTEKVGERPTDKIGSATREQADKVDQGREEPGAALVASHQRPHQRSQQRAQRAFDRHQVGLHRTAPHHDAAAGTRRRCRCLTHHGSPCPQGRRWAPSPWTCTSIRSAAQGNHRPGA